MQLSFCFFDVVLTTRGLLACASVAAHELIDTTCCVNELALTSVEGVRAAGDFELHDGIGLAFKFHGVSGLGSGTAQEHIAIAHVLEHNRTIVVGMNTLFHCLLFFNAGLVYRR